MCHCRTRQLPATAEGIIPVQIYGLDGSTTRDLAVVGSSVPDKIKRLGVKVTPAVIDLLSIALSVTAADTFVRRKDATDGWTRELTVQLPLFDPSPWLKVQEKLEKALQFLSGDIWKFDFSDGGFPPPTPYSRSRRVHLVELQDRNCVCLFSGGLDSAIGAIDLLADERKPLLESHAYKGDKSHQDAVAERLQGQFSRFAANAYPVSAHAMTDISMRTRSLNFLAFGALGACAIESINQFPRVELVVPENGFISLNAPLTSRRIGSLSTRTTHPHFIRTVQEILDDVDIRCDIRTPYQFQTKGEMIISCQNQSLLHEVLEYTVSCSRWKRRNQQCGCCIPCLVRRAAFHKANLHQKDQYIYKHLATVLTEVDRRDDLLAMAIAVQELNARPVGAWILESGPLAPEDFEKHRSVWIAGLMEVKAFLEKEGILCL